MKLPIKFASGSFIDGDGKTILPSAIINRLNVHDDLVRSTELLLGCCQDTACPSLVIQDAQNTLDAVKNFK